MILDRARLLDVAERASWTAIETAGAFAVVSAARSATGTRRGEHATGRHRAMSLAIVAAGLAVTKSAIATRYGAGSAATLPAGVEPVPAARAVVVETAAGLVVAGPAPHDDGTGMPIVTGTPVDVTIAAALGRPALTPGDVWADETIDTTHLRPVGQLD